MTSNKRIHELFKRQEDMYAKSDKEWSTLSPAELLKKSYEYSKVTAIGNVLEELEKSQEDKENS